MGQAANDLEASAGVVKGLQGQLEGHKAEVRAAWSGQASTAFENVFNQFNEDFRKVLAAMNGMHESLVQTRLTYEAQEQASQETVNRVQNLLSGG
jgi:WXG100 family type VII secretion target